MRLASGTIASLVLTIGALLFLVGVEYSSNTVSNSGRTPKSAFLRSSTRRKLYNYSTNGEYSNSYNSDGNSDSSYNSDQSSYNQAYDNSNYATDDASAASATDDASAASSASAYYGNYGNDDNAYYNSNSAYQANAYNGRDQSWDGQSVQMYNDDEVPEIEEEGYDNQWEILDKFGGLSANEAFAVAGLAVMASLTAFLFVLLGSGYNIIDLCQLYCCCGIFSHTDEAAGDAIEDGFVKIDDP